MRLYKLSTLFYMCNLYFYICFTATFSDNLSTNDVVKPYSLQGRKTKAFQDLTICRVITGRCYFIVHISIMRSLADKGF